MLEHLGSRSKKSIVFVAHKIVSVKVIKDLCVDHRPHELADDANEDDVSI